MASYNETIIELLEVLSRDRLVLIVLHFTQLMEQAGDVKRSILTNSFCFKINISLCVYFSHNHFTRRKCFIEIPTLVNYWTCCSSFSVQFLGLLYEYSPSCEMVIRVLMEDVYIKSLYFYFRRESRQFLSWFIFASFYPLSF